MTTNVMEMFTDRLRTLEGSASGSRHEALVSLVGWTFGMKHLDLRWAMARIEASWYTLTAGEGRGDEVEDVAAWVVGQRTAEAATQRVPVGATSDPMFATDADDDADGGVYGLTDTDNAERLVRLYGDRIRYVEEDRSWVVWDGHRWKHDVRRVPEMAKQTIRKAQRDCVNHPDRYPAKAIEKLTAALNGPRLREMVKLAQTDERVAISAVDMDTNIWLLNCANGTVDLRTGELKEADPADLITKTTGVEFDPAAECPQWESFVSWAMQGRSELVTFMMRAVGMSLTGDTSERVILFCHGGGKNGKSVTLKVIRAILGDGYGQRMQSSTLEAVSLKRGGAAHTEDVAALKGARFAYTSEMEDGSRFATALLKDLTGDERIRARQLYRSSFEFQPEFTPWIAANHKPAVAAEDQAIWDRLRLIPFDSRIADDEKDPHLGTKLLTEAAGILAWAVRGCLDWQREGLNQPAEVIEATNDYREEMDVFAEFLRAVIGGELHVGNRTSTDLRTAYHGWARGNVDADDPLYKPSQKEFKRQMEGHGWTILTTRTARCWVAPITSLLTVEMLDELIAIEERWGRGGLVTDATL